jgi:hypothetical protein
MSLLCGFGSSISPECESVYTDPTFHFNAGQDINPDPSPHQSAANLRLLVSNGDSDPDPAFHSNADPVPASQNTVDPNPQAQPYCFHLSIQLILYEHRRTKM